MSTAIVPAAPTALALDPESPEFQEQVRTGAMELARVFNESIEGMRKSWAQFEAHTARLDEAFKPVVPDQWPRRRFEVRLTSEHRDRSEKLEEIVKAFNVKAWSILIDQLGVKSLMSIKRRAEFDKQLESGDVPPVTEEAILSVLTGLAGQAKQFATEAAVEALKLLTPNRSGYKTNSAFKVGKKVVMSYYVERGYSKPFRVNYNRQAELNAIDGTFHVLDGKGLIRGHEGPLATAIRESEDGRGETDYFRFKCFKNCNLHLEFRRLDLVKELNGLATGEYVLGQDAD